MNKPAKHDYAKRLKRNTYAFIAAMLITVFTAGIVVAVDIQNIKGQAERYAQDVEQDYSNLILSYKRSFETVYGSIVDKIEEDPSFEEMDDWLKSKDKTFSEAMGSEIYDGIAISYKGGYAHSWNYGDYSTYDPTTRSWYKTAAESNGETAVVAPYVTYLDSQYLDNDSYILMSIVKKYNDEISFDYDIKLKEVDGLLENRKPLYDGSDLFMYDPDGYILGSSNEDMFAHNVRSSDTVISDDLTVALAEAENSPGKLRLAWVDGGFKCLFIANDSAGNSICMLIPVTAIIVNDFLAVLLVLLLLTVFEIYLFARNRKSLVEYSNRAAQLSAITDATYLERLYVRTDDLLFYGNNTAESHFSDDSYRQLFKELRLKVNADERDKFDDYLSPDIIKSSDEELNRLSSKRFIMDWPDVGGGDKHGTYEISRMFSLSEGKRTACLLVRDVSEDAAILKAALRQAEDANAAKSLFLSRMSHEIRTPMNAIVGITAIAKQHENEAQRVDDYLSKIETSSRVLLNIINDVLDMSAIESSKLKIAKEEFDIKQILANVSTIYYPQCENKGINFEMNADLEDEIFVGDSLRVNQILMNLISNAYKFTDKGGTISVSARETSRRERTAFIRFRVEDTGTGMTEDMLTRLFHPFEQENAVTAQRYGGSGLGLSIVKNLTDLMNGGISVESEKGKGTVFTLDLPFEITGKKNNADAGLISSIRILAVDDDPSAREYTAIVLRRIGVMFDTADSGETALKMMSEAENDNHPYDAIMLDWKMPVMDGVELTRKIREQEKHHTMIIVVSAYNLNEVEDEAKAAGADHFVAKPLFQSTIFNMLMTLSGGQMHNDSAKPNDYDFSGKRALLAEDNDLNAEIAGELLAMVNLEMDRAENGQIALDMFKNSSAGTYDVILMDMQMPVLDGCGATRAIRALDRDDAKTIPIYAMTANAFTEDVALALSSGMNGHIAKPVDTKIFYSTLEAGMK